MWSHLKWISSKLFKFTQQGVWVYGLHVRCKIDCNTSNCQPIFLPSRHLALFTEDVVELRQRALEFTGCVQCSVLELKNVSTVMSAESGSKFGARKNSTSNIVEESA